MLSPALIAGLLLLGSGAGFLAGLLGIGGGMILVPFIVLLLEHQGFPPALLVKIAVATSLATILFTSVSSVRAHHARGAVRWKVVGGLAPGIVAGSLLGAQVAGALPAGLLTLVFAGFVGYSATQMLVDRKPQPGRQLPGTAGLLGMGGVIGGVSALVGAGGAFLSVPFMTWCNLSIHLAVGTAAALGFPIALAGTAGYMLAGQHLDGLPPGLLGYVYLPALAVIATASMLTAPLGARVSHALDVAQLRRVFALLLYGVAGWMLWRAVRH
ncbi:MAG TPA: sulfite exporter TauE/SafE family protein [Methylibium sp.]|nr:sulfite exporter TauE/SafE family protein [Methylibium sp.]